MMSPISPQCCNELKHQNKKLKRREKELEDMFNEQDEDNQRRINEYKAEQKKLIEKTDSLELQLTNVISEKEELAEKLVVLTKSLSKVKPAQQSSSDSQAPVDNSQTSSKDFSHIVETVRTLNEEKTELQNDYANLQEKYDALNVEKGYLQEQLKEITEKITEFYNVIDFLEDKCSAQEEAIGKLHQTNNRLVEENQDLHESAHYLQSRLDDVSRSSSSCEHQSLFEEMEEAKMTDCTNNTGNLPSLRFDDDFGFHHTSLPDPDVEDKESGFGDCSSDSERHQVVYSQYEVTKLKKNYDENVKCLEDDLDRLKDERGKLIKVIENQTSQVVQLKGEVENKTLPIFQMFLFVLISFVIFYVSFCVHQEFPVFFFVDSKLLSFKHFTNGMPPM
jgi:predicted nuclease with TOPRIM domain